MTRQRRRVHTLTWRTGLACAALAFPLTAQTHKVTNPETVVRAVAVYEWTGDMSKPGAMRLIPVSLFINSKYEDADVYQARPVPFALESGNLYEIDKAGVPVGTLSIAFSKHLIASSTAATTYDDGWFGYGKFLPPAPPKPSDLKPVAHVAKINGLDDQDDDRPHFSSRSAAPGSGGAATPVGGVSPAPSAQTPGDDPDRPTLHRSGSGSSADAGVPPDVNDPDRPTLKKHPTDARAGAVQDDVAPIAALNDPNRPTLHRGKPINALNEDDLPRLTGLPPEKDLQQRAAVSDAKDRPQHDFARPWEGDDEHKAILSRMEDEARQQLAAYEAANGVKPAAPAPAAKPATTAAHKATTTATHRTTTKTAPAPPPPPEALQDEELMGYELSYGGQPTFVYHAHTDGTNGTIRYVTLVAQTDGAGNPQFALKNVTDADHLDRTPRMRLVDAVDADASNRASLLFELRAQNSRQFALYRVIGGRAEQTFATGSTQ